MIPKTLVFSTRSYQNYTSISVYIFISLEKTHQICLHDVQKSDIYDFFVVKTIVLVGAHGQTYKLFFLIFEGQILVKISK